MSSTASVESSESNHSIKPWLRAAGQVLQTHCCFLKHEASNFLEQGQHYFFVDEITNVAFSASITILITGNTIEVLSLLDAEKVFSQERNHFFKRGHER
jgi:hypothetical protein